MKNKKLISIVTPCFNEELYIVDVYEKVKNVFESDLTQYDWELIYAENGSHDESYNKIKRLTQKDIRVKSVRLSRNFKYEGGICSGLYYAVGDAAIVIDCDLQDPVELIPEFIKHYENGYHVVYGVRRSRKEGFIKRTSYSLFYFLLGAISELNFPRNAGEFCLMDKKVYKLIANLKEQHKFIRALRFWTGFRQIGIPYDRLAREKGETKHPFRAMTELALDGLLSFSAFPLRLVFYVGLFVTIISLSGLIYAIIWRFMNPGKIPGYAALLSLIFTLGGIQMLSIGVLGEYMYRIYDEVRDRPGFIVHETLNIKNKSTNVEKLNNT